MFMAKCGNDSYVQKIYGGPVVIDDVIIGYVFLIVLLGLLIGPIILFSDYALTQENPA